MAKSTDQQIQKKLVKNPKKEVKKFVVTEGIKQVLWQVLQQQQQQHWTNFQESRKKYKLYLSVKGAKSTIPVRN